MNISPGHLKSIIHEIVLNEIDDMGRLSSDMGNNLVETDDPFLIAPIVVPEDPEKFNELVAKAVIDSSNTFKRRVDSNENISSVLNGISNRINDITVDSSSILRESSNVETIEVNNIEDLIDIGIVTGDEIEILRENFAIEAVESLIDGCISATDQPTTRDYIKRVLANGFEMLIFGIVDNAILIFAGDWIDGKIGGRLIRNVGISGKYYQIVTVGFVTAGLGNAVSDGVGAAIAGPALSATGFSPENWVTDKEMENAPEFWRSLDELAGTIGVIVGCIIGLVPAFFLDSYKTALAAAGFAWGAKALAASTQIELPFAATAAKAATGVTATGAAIFAGAVIVVGTGLFGLYSWGSLKSAQSRNNQAGLKNHQINALLDLGIKVMGEEGEWRKEITNKDIFLFSQAVRERKDEVQEVWNEHMHPTQIAAEWSSYDKDALYEDVQALSTKYGLGFPTNMRQIRESVLCESRWQKLAGII